MSILDKAHLKDIAESDLVMLLNWRNQDHIREMMYSSSIISSDEHQDWFQRLQGNPSSKSLVFYFGKQPYGVININRINQKNLTCEWGFYIGEQEAPKGLGTILGYKAIEYIFEKLKMRKISAEVLDFNHVSLNFHKKLGFIQEGCLREQVLKGNKYEDVILMGLFAEQWDTKSRRLKEQLERRV